MATAHKQGTTAHEVFEILSTAGISQLNKVRDNGVKTPRKTRGKTETKQAVKPTKR